MTLRPTLQNVPVLAKRWGSNVLAINVVLALLPYDDGRNAYK